MDVSTPFRSCPQELQPPDVEQEGLPYSPLDIYQKDKPTIEHAEVCHIKNELNSSYTDESIGSTAGDLLIDSGTSRESDSGSLNQWPSPQRSQFNDLLCGGAALQVQLKERILNYFCSYCSKGFAKKQQLQNHIKTHTQEKNFVCATCNKTFVHKQQLTNHEKTHSGVKDFECDMCGKRFSLKQQMQIHIKTHTGEKNFGCDMCEKKFITKQQLQNHVNSHLGVKPFTCSVCGKNFAHKQQLTRHESRHMLQTHFCVECNLKFSGNKRLSKHINEVHNRIFNSL